MRRELRLLASTGYERELDSVLEDLYLSFAKWKNKQINCFELNRLIHEFHQKKSRELWKIYNQPDDDFIVVRAARLGVLQPAEISQQTAEAIQLDPLINRDRAWDKNQSR